MSWENSPIKGLKYVNGDAVEILDVYNRGLSAPKQYRGANPIVFFREVESVDGEGSIRIPVATAVIPSGVKRALLLFTKDKGKTEESYQVAVIERNLDTFPAGSYQICNSSRYNLAGKIGEKQFRLGPGDIKCVKMPVSEKQNVEVKFANEIDGTWTLFYSSVWGSKANRRVNIFVVESPNPNHPIEMRRYEQYVR